MGTYVVLLGGPGAGKGTQAEMLVKELGTPQVSTGDLFRENLRNETELGKLAKGYMDRGELVPDQVTVDMVRERFRRPDCAGGALFDGFPRTIRQAEGLDALLVEMGEEVAVVPYIKVDPRTLLERLAGRWTCRQCGAMYHVIFSPPQEAGVCDKCGGELYQRADDTRETQQHRIDVYFEQTAPLIQWYLDRGLLVEVDGEQSIEAVGIELLAAVRAATGQGVRR
jgi:adenylate kinase